MKQQTIEPALVIIWLSDVCAEEIEARRGDPLLKLLKELGGFPVVEGDNWNEEGFDWMKTITDLRKLNNDILVTIWVGPDIKNSDDNIVQVGYIITLVGSVSQFVSMRLIVNEEVSSILH